MNLITVDEQRCTFCGLCIRVCPMRILKLGEGGPCPGRDAEKLCINCGRCVDRCPVCALYHRYRKYGKRRSGASVSP